MNTNEIPEDNHPGGPVEQALEHIQKAERDLERAREDERGAEVELNEATQELEEAERETEIIVNGRRRAVPGDEVCFEEVVELAFPGPHTDPNVIYSITYRHAASHPSAGELAPGGRVKVKNGTIFNVTKTIKS